MKHQKLILTGILLFTCHLLPAQERLGRNESVYRMMPVDSEAYYFTSENFNIRADGIMDVTDALQEAINQVKTEKNFGILFIPEGKYRISKTIYLPAAIRLIGYGKNRRDIQF